MTSELESNLKRIEAHLEVACGGIYPSVYAVHQAQADLRNVDVPYLLKVIREQQDQLKLQKNALKTIDEVVDQWDNGALINGPEGIAWHEPAESVPTGIDKVRQALKEALSE